MSTPVRFEKVVLLLFAIGVLAAGGSTNPAKGRVVPPGA
jgi:hypothetical protein